MKFRSIFFIAFLYTQMFFPSEFSSFKSLTIRKISHIAEKSGFKRYCINFCQKSIQVSNNGFRSNERPFFFLYETIINDCRNFLLSILCAFRNGHANSHTTRNMYNSTTYMNFVVDDSEGNSTYENGP